MPASKRLARLLSPLALALLCAGSPPRYADRLKEFEARAAEKRKALGYSQAQIDALFPPPRIALTGPVALPLIRPGQAGQVHALFTPPLAGGALAAFDCDGVVVSDLKQTATQLDATLSVPLFHPQRTCSLSVHQPVSLHTASVPAFRVDGTYVWSLSLSNGMAVRWTAKMDQLVGRPTTSKWQLSSGTEQRTLLVDRDGEGGGRFIAEVEHTERDNEVTVARRDTPEQRLKAYEAEAEALAKKLATCEGLPRDRLLACVNQYSPQLQDLLARQPSSNPNERVRIIHPTVCDELTLDVASDGKITGVALGCAGGGDVTVTGSLTVAEP